MLPLQYIVGDIAKTTLVAIATEVAKTCSYEDGRPVIEEKIRPSKLLQCLQHNAKNRPIRHPRPSEHLVPTRLAASMLGIEGFEKLLLYLVMMF